MSRGYTVRAARCDHRASAGEIYRTLERITAPLTRSWERLERARRIVLKFNMTEPDTARFAGRRQVVPDALIASDHTTATDACATHLMGHDPTADWPTPPFRRDRNHLLVAPERGYGTVDLRHIDFQSELQAPLAAFDSDQQDPPSTVVAIRRSACEQALFYRAERERLVRRYPGELVVLRARSRLADINAGLLSLIAEVERREIRSIALPPLGCGLGGLKWTDVKPCIRRAFAGVADLDTLVFEPHGTDSRRRYRSESRSGRQ